MTVTSARNHAFLPEDTVAEGGSEPKIAVDIRRVKERTELHSAESDVIEFVRDDF